MDCPVFSLEINLAENLGGRSAGDVYDKMREFETIQDLHFKRSGISLKSKPLQTLVLSMPIRVFKMIRTNDFKIRILMQKNELSFNFWDTQV